MQQNKLPEFIQQQYEFSAHIRNPEKNPAPDGIEDRRMAIYRNLFYNNIENFISGGFPVLRSITKDADWHQMIRAFFTDHRCHTPYFAKISEEFLSWFQENTDALSNAPDFALELAHYEWTELALSTSDADKDQKDVDHNGDILAQHPVISPIAWHLVYEYPVHLASPEFQPEAQPTFLVVYRDRMDEIHFLEINPVTYRLIDILKENPHITGQKAVEQIIEELQHPDPDSVASHGRQLLYDLRNRNIIIGTD